MAVPDIKSHRHSTNPFLENWEPPFVEKMKRIDVTGKGYLDNKGVELTGKMLVPIKKDADRFVKLVHSTLSELTNLSTTAVAVLAYIMHQALPNNSIVYLPTEEALEFCRFRQPKSFYDGLNELILYQFVARSEKRYFYFLNPQKLFNGRRKNMKALYHKPRKHAA
ncbi:hypothetical protein GCM10011378_41350 [Hymenobacter glacieicola]|uniref:Plasmid replication protein RepL domain-containing protein n=2 Tax=Hymenobacter glacieicola TaxID=1562124 RepID=A0ABQ1X5M9_9BACT|nr:hypothetical protein GCM10011378_41350 [Hymenobacter glacieicola]